MKSIIIIIKFNINLMKILLIKIWKYKINKTKKIKKIKNYLQILIIQILKIIKNKIKNC